MNSPRLLRIGLLALSAVGIVGCSNMSNSSRGRVVAAQRQQPFTFALSVTVKGGLQPTPEQWAAIQARISGELLAAGHVLVTDLSIADRIIRVDFRPNPSDPGNSGNAVIVSVRDNPLRQLALVTPPAVSPVRSTPYPTSFGFGQSSFLNSYYSLSDPYNPFGSSYYGFGHSYYDGYTYSSPSLIPTKPITPPVTPVTPVTPPRHGPGRHSPGLPPGERPVCPPLLAVSNPVAPSTARVAYPSDRPVRTFVAPRSVPSESHAYASSDRADRSAARSDTGSWVRSFFGGSSSSDSYSQAERYDRYTSHGSVDNSAASARRAESRSVSERSYSRDTTYRDDSARTKSDYSNSSSSGSSSYSSYSSSSSSSYSSGSSFSSSSSSSYSAPAASSASSSGGSSGTHDSSSNTQQH